MISFILNNALSDIKLTQIIDLIKETYPTNMGQLYNVTSMH